MGFKILPALLARGGAFLADARARRAALPALGGAKRKKSSEDRLAIPSFMVAFHLAAIPLDGKPACWIRHRCVNA
eukprot:7633169-Heterocapsa_arctica.AAC.1